MEMILQNQKSVQIKDVFLFVVVLILFPFAYLCSKARSIDSHFYDESVIEKGTTVERKDSVTTIVIPDKL